ncbi:MAG: DUF4902 domain-containing protein [Rhodanobacteraceae bacterium]|nr:MAG: DUF4902 domain-containing protein [Rhodanobacteraceae bacterium]
MNMQIASGLAGSPPLSFDGYVRLPFEALAGLEFGRKVAWEDADLAGELQAEGLPAVRAGYCEWETAGTTVVTIGWTWFAGARGSFFIAPGCVNSNLMLVTPKNFDLGASRTSELLRAWLSGVKWQPEVVQKEFAA